MVVISMQDTLQLDEVITLYRANEWSSADKPALLMQALRNSDTLVTARISGKLVGIGNAISDGFLVVYYPHLLVHPSFHGQGIGKQLMQALQQKYTNFHQQMLTADGDAVGFYEEFGFEKAGKAQAMWVYSGNDH